MFPLTHTLEMDEWSSSVGTHRPNFVSTLKFINMNSIEGKNLESLACLDFSGLMMRLSKRQKMTTVVQLPKYFQKLAGTWHIKKERYIHGGAVMSLSHKDNLFTGKILTFRTPENLL